MDHGFAPITADRQKVEESIVLDAEQNLLNGTQLDVIPITWDYGRPHDSWWAPFWEFDLPDGSGLLAKRADMEATFGGTGRRLAMMYSISAVGDEGNYAPALNGQLDAGWRSMAEDLVSMGMGDAYIRPNPEHSRDWSRRYPHDGSGTKLTPSAAGDVYGRAFARCVSVMNSVSGANFDFLYSPAGRFHGADIGANEGPATDITLEAWPPHAPNWPSGADPPIVCPSYYDTLQNGGPSRDQWATMTDAQREAAAMDLWETTDRANLHSYTRWANEVGAPMGLVEWGVHTPEGSVGRGENPYFINLVMDYMMEQGFEFETVWSYYHASGSNTVFWAPELSSLPESRAAWVENVLADSGGGTGPDDGGDTTPAEPDSGGNLGTAALLYFLLRELG